MIPPVLFEVPFSLCYERCGSFVQHRRFTKKRLAKSNPSCACGSRFGPQITASSDDPDTAVDQPRPLAGYWSVFRRLGREIVLLGVITRQ